MGAPSSQTQHPRSAWTRIIGISAILYFVSQVLFLINIQFPVGYDFDEFHYVPAAKQFMKFDEPRNLEHPPLGKWIMAASISVWGDRPIGWRFASTVFGALTLVGTFLWAIALFRDIEIALWIAAITLFNQLLYVQARIGMLDTFMYAFLVWGLATFTASWEPSLGAKSVRKLWLFTGVMFGLATACKWFAVVPWVGCLGMVVLVRLMQQWKMVFADPHRDDWYSPQLWHDIPLREAFAWLLVIPFFVYYMTFVPFLFFSKSTWNIWDLFILQRNMYNDQLRVVNNHPYMSGWKDWPLMTRPIWYAFDHDGSFVRGVLLLGNPLVMWTGLVALLMCFWGWLTTRGRDAFLVVFFYFIFFASWVVIPRKVAFYYYYYPAGMVLSFALGYVFYHLEKPPNFKKPWPRWIFFAVTFGLFVYFFPILAALKIPGETFRKWMWFNSWI